MKSKDLKQLKISLHGMDNRMRKMMDSYFKLSCKGAAIVVDEDEAHAEIVDVDLSLSKSLLEERLAQHPSKPIIALSLNEISTSGAIYVKKPIEVTDVLVAFGVAKDIILGKTYLKTTDKPIETFSKISNRHVLNETKTFHKIRLEINKVVSGRPSNALLGELWDRKSLITGLTCLFLLIAGIYIFQLMPIYEDRAQKYQARAKIFISNIKPKYIDVNSSFTEDPLDLDKQVAQTIINEIASRQLAGRVITTLQLNTIPEFIIASDSDREQSKTRQERLTNIKGYFLQNLKVSQFKNSPVIHIDYKAKDPELASRIANQVAREYRAMQQYKKIEKERKLAEQEIKERPIANQNTEKIANRVRSVTVLAAPINYEKVNTNSNATSRITSPDDSSGTGNDPLAHEKVITSMVGNSRDVNVDANKPIVNIQSTEKMIKNITNGNDFGTVISKATADTLTTGNFTHNLANGDHFGGMVSNQVTNIGIDNPKLGGVNITTHVGIISVSP